MLNLNDNNLLSWSSLGDIEKGRNRLGDEMPVIIFRLFQYSVRQELIKRFGLKITQSLFRDAGKAAGETFVKNKLNLDLPFAEFFAHLVDVLQQYKIGVLNIEDFDTTTGKFMLTVSEDVDCSGLPVSDRAVCNYDEGFICAILEMYTKKEYIVIETDCWATGAEICRFCATVKDEE